MRNKILAIVITFNGEADISSCLNSIAHSIIPIDALVIDNNSKDHTIDIIEKKYPKTIILKQPNNLGFGAANNIGIEYALKNKYDFVLLLNQDAEITPNAISSLLVTSQKNDSFYIISPIHQNKKTNSIDPLFQKYCKNTNLNEDINTADFINAAIWFMPISAIKKVGGFDPIFPHYGEDNDYVNRVHYWGGKIAIDTKAIGYHNREIHPIPIDKLQYRMNLSYLGMTKNINHSLYSNIIHSLYLVLKKTVKTTIALKFKYYHLKSFFFIVCNYQKVKQSYYKSLSSQSFLSKEY